MSALIWELVKHNNAFIIKGLNGVTFSKEAGNLASKNTYKYSGLANLGKTIDVTSTDNCITVVKSSKSGKLGATKISKNARRTNYAVGKEAQSVRPDLKRAAQAKASTLKKGLLIRKKNSAVPNLM